MASTQFDRASKEACGIVVRELFGNAAGRELVLRQLLRSVAMAGRIAPNAWAVTLTTQNLRLNVGNQEVFVAGAGDFFLNCAACPEDRAFDGIHTEPARYALAQPQCRVRGSLTELAELGSDVQRAHEGFIRLAGTTSSGKPFAGTRYARSHSAGLIEFARQEFGECV